MGGPVIRCIADASVTAVDFDGTLAHLRVDWDGLKKQVADEARRIGSTWSDNEGLDANLRRIRRETSDAAFKRLCQLVSRAELDAFDASTVNTRLLGALIKRGSRPTAVCTANTRQAIEKLLRESIFDGLNPYLVAKEDVASGKPNPEGLLKICQHFGASPASCVYIGNAEQDRLAAEAGGFRFIWVQAESSTETGQH